MIRPISAQSDSPSVSAESASSAPDPSGDASLVASHVVPASLATPVMRQYLEVKERYFDCIIFFRLGDFYEMFYDDAVVASQLLDLTLTARDKQRETPVPMCGVPYHAAKHYVAKLVALGKKVAICDQVEDARKTKKIVRRAVTQVITPGVILEEEQLEPKAGHYLAAICLGGDGQTLAGIAYLDVSTGEFAATEVSAGDASEELARIDAAELLVVPEFGGPAASAGATKPSSATAELATQLHKRLRVAVGHSRAYASQEDRALLAPLVGTGIDSLPVWLAAAAAACMRYAQATQPTGGLPLYRLRLYRPGESLIIDESTRANLELLQTLMERKRQGSLIGVIDQTKTAMGGRLLRRWLLEPLQDLPSISRRHDAVEWLVERQSLRQALRELLGEIYDLERLAGRLGAQVATPRDLYSLGQGLLQVPKLVAMLLQAESSADGSGAKPLPALLDLGPDLCQDVADCIVKAIADNPPIIWREGGFIRRGYSERLDECIDLSQGGKDRILAIEERERERSGISSLKIRYNKVFGYYIEITRANLARVPADYIRKQTTANAERYVTSELAEYEATVLGAEEKRVELEIELFEALRKELLATTQRLLQLAERVAQIDTLAGLGELAHRNGYVRPTMTAGLRLSIEEGRHPVVEQMAERGRFVPNDTLLDPDGPGAEQMLILTGPNMAGKSTVMRQVALISIMAQMGSFVPAERAEIGVVDRVCTRVGASDNLARGESTFMVEMRETSQILDRATRRSLVILDEIGRGTSTYDGVSIAWAVAEYLHDVVGCKTLFATHYHELAALAESRPRVRNFSVAVRKWQGEIVFLHKLVAGGPNRSYGIEVPGVAGLPRIVVDRARQILAELEAVGAGNAVAESGSPAHGRPRTSQLPLFVLPNSGAAATSARRAEAVDTSAACAEPVAPALPDPAVAEVLSSLRGLDCDELAPRQALDLLAKLCQRLKN